MWAHQEGTIQRNWTDMTYIVENYNGGGIQLGLRLTINLMQGLDAEEKSSAFLYTKNSKTTNKDR